MPHAAPKDGLHPDRREPTLRHGRVGSSPSRLSLGVVLAETRSPAAASTRGASSSSWLRGFLTAKAARRFRHARSARASRSGSGGRRTVIRAFTAREDLARAMSERTREELEGSARRRAGCIADQWGAGAPWLHARETAPRAGTLQRARPRSAPRRWVSVRTNGSRAQLSRSRGQRS